MTKREKIEALRIEAGEAGDYAQVALCDAALAGDERARELCMYVISEAANADRCLEELDRREEVC